MAPAGVGALDELIADYHAAAGAFLRGDPEPYKALFSRRDDVTLANPFGPVARGWSEAAATMERAAAKYRDGEVVGFETLARAESGELAFIVELERFRARVGGGDAIVPVALRTTSVFRREDGVWRILHRHADPITGVRPAESVVQAEGELWLG